MAIHLKVRVPPRIRSHGHLLEANREIAKFFTISRNPRLRKPLP